MNLDPSTLVTGGLIAAVAGFWQQVKSALSYVSGFILVRADMSPHLSSMVYSHLKTEYRMLPSGSHYYESNLLQVVSVGTYPVPYKLPKDVVIFYRGLHVVLCHLRSDSISLTTVRGSLKFETLIAKAIRSEFLHTNPGKRSNNFYVRVLSGREKFAYGPVAAHAISNSGSGQPDTDASSNSYSSIAAPRISRDDSFLIPRSQLCVQSPERPSCEFYDPDTEGLIREAEKWLSMQDWYTERSLPWRRGWLLQGQPGTGKSRLAYNVALRLGIPLFIFDLGTFSNQELNEEWLSLNTPCVALIEDIDAVFDGRTPLTEHKLLSFDGFLNTLNGVDPNRGVLTIITTNHPEKLDPALARQDGVGVPSRPGRIDRVHTLGPASERVRYAMVRHILRDWPESHEELVQSGVGLAVAQFQEVCVGYALAKMESTYDETHHVVP